MQHSLMKWSRNVRNTLVDPVGASIASVGWRQARLLSALLIPIFAVQVFVSSWSGTSSGYVIYFVLNVVIFASVYLLNRFGYYLVAAGIVCVLVSAWAFINFLLRIYYGVPSPEISLMRVVLAILIAYVLLPLRGLLIFSIVSVLGLIITGLVARGSFPLLFTTIYFTLITSALMVIAAMARGQHLTQIELQARELGESEARFRNLLDASFETIIVHKEGLILDANPAVEGLMGYKPSEIIGKSSLDFIDAKYHPKILETIRTGSSEPYEVLLRHKNGSALHAELRGKTQWYRGQLVRVVAIRDITERKIQEELLIEREKVRSLQNFIRNLSHDLRTPLSVINTSIYLIEKLAEDPPRQHHQINVLQAQAEHMQRLLEDLLNMARLDKADTSDFKFHWATVNEPVTEAIRDHQNLALRKKQTLTYVLGSHLPQVLLDLDQFKLAVKHLILNGLSYSPDGGTVCVETRADTEHVIVEVRDNGAGIQALDLPHIFEHFYRGDRSRGDDGGTGVGLTIAKKIIEAHGGTITAESKPGEGSVFSILLPLPPDAEDENEEGTA